MNNKITFFVVVALVLFGLETNAQVTNLKINGFTSNFILNQAQGITWEANLPVGGTATCELWIHLAGSSFIDPSVDKSVFGVFTQTDGDIGGNNGPGDMDSTKNGHVLLTIPTIHLAPGNYIFKMSNGGVTAQISGLVVAMPSPAYTITGKFTPAAGKSAQNVLITAESKNSGMVQSLALTDAGGNYTLNFIAIEQGVTLKTYVVDDLSPYIASPADTTLTLTSSMTNVNFKAITAAAKIVGYLKGEDGHIFSNVRIECYPQNGGDNNSSKRVFTDANGLFAIGFTTNEVNNYPMWSIWVGEGVYPLYMPPQSSSISIHTGDSLRTDLTAYVADDSITGRITVDGKLPNGVATTAYAQVQNIAQTQVDADPFTGAFILHVAKKLSPFYVGVNNTPDGYGFDWNNQQQVATGTKNIVLNVVTLSWLQQATTTGNTLNAVSFANTTKGWVAGNNGTLLATTNGGVTWTSQNSSSTANLYCLSFVDGSTGWFGGSGGSIKKTTNGGTNWLSQNSTTTSDILAMQFISANTGWAAGGGSGSGVILKTTNGGSNWISQYTGAYGTATSISMLDANTGYAICGFGSVIKTTDGGTNWNYISNTSGSIIKFVNANNGFATGTSSDIYITTDGGNNWTPTWIDNSGTVRGLYCLDASTLWAISDNAGIFKTTNAGATWTRQLVSNNNSGTGLLGIYFLDANNGWIVGNNGLILHTSNGGMVDVRDSKLSSKINTFSLSQNYPNPFNPSTIISYSVAPNTKSGMSHVTLKIYNMLGEEVAVLVDGERSAGAYKATFNGKGLTSGIYFYSLKAGGFAEVKKMILMK